MRWGLPTGRGRPTSPSPSLLQRVPSLSPLRGRRGRNSLDTPEPFRGDGRREPGFTLVETLVVLTIVALLTAAAPMIVSGLPGVRLRAAADDLATTLRQLRRQAIRGGETTALTFDPAARSYRASTDRLARPLPAAVAKIGFETTALWRADPSPTVRFFADGSATGARIVLENGARSAAVTVDWLSGRVRRDD
ncbi:MAG TPA: GspH/FimT family pseudopilin [Stellaceae bacterium]